MVVYCVTIFHKYCFPNLYWIHWNYLVTWFSQNSNTIVIVFNGSKNMLHFDTQWSRFDNLKKTCSMSKPSPIYYENQGNFLRKGKVLTLPRVLSVSIFYPGWRLVKLLLCWAGCRVGPLGWAGAKTFHLTSMDPTHIYWWVLLSTQELDRIGVIDPTVRGFFGLKC